MILKPHPSSGVSAHRILLYSHDSFGLGHLRRTTTIAHALREAFPRANILIVTGSPCATHFPLPSGVDAIKLPSATKDQAGRYVPRSMLGDLDGMLRIRRRLLLEIQASFSPHLLIVDHQVLGLCDELDLVLARARGEGTKTILGVRDIIDAPEIVAREWGRPRVRRALCEEYDRVCVYGSPEVFDPRVEYPVPPELAQRMEFTGYIARDSAAPGTSSIQRLPGEPRPRSEVLVTVGGGEDGAERVEAYLDALDIAPATWTSTIVLGPLFDPARARDLKRRTRAMEGVHMQLFHADLPHLLAQSDAVVAMAGYNTVVEILQSGLPAIFLPRSFPRREQLLRAERLSALGLAECLPVPSPETLRAAVDRALHRRAPEGKGRMPRREVPLNGCASLCKVVAGLLAPRSATSIRTLAP